jgi:hypothetical protein
MDRKVRQGTLAPRALPRFTATTSPSDSRLGRAAVMHSRISLAGRHARRLVTGPGLPGSSLICRRPLSPLTPGSPSAARARCFTDGVRFRPFWKVDHYHWFNEAEMGSLTLRLTSSPSRASTARLPAPPPSRLHGERASAMGSTFQLTRSTRLRPGAPEGNEENEGNQKTCKKCLFVFHSTWFFLKSSMTNPARLFR